MENLNKLNLLGPIYEASSKGVPILGICLGMQLLADVGDEFGPNNGLGLINGRVTLMEVNKSKDRLPHIGWNSISCLKIVKLLTNIDEGSTFYFVHSYSYKDYEAEYVKGLTDFSGSKVAVIEKNNIFGVQFHPEKSQKNGLKILSNFCSIINKSKRC